jgi:hypothetical protein
MAFKVPKIRKILKVASKIVKLTLSKSKKLKQSFKITAESLWRNSKRVRY